MANPTHHAKGRLRDARGRFITLASLLDEEMFDAIHPHTIVLALEDAQPSCLNERYGLIIDPSFWGAGATRPATE